MGKAQLEIHPVGRLATNCYFLINSETQECIITDPGDNAALLENRIREKGYKPVAILVTHGHFDHILAANRLREDLKVRIIAFKEEEELLVDTKERLFGMVDDESQLVVNADEFLSDGDILDLAGFKIRVLHTPGHSKGSCCYYLEEEKILLSGDTLFEGSVGRTDFPTGSMKEMDHSINEVLMKLPDDVEVFPGHGGSTTIGIERNANPYVR
ncbi:MAG: MBL fold metallo-hydrolase [Lachnospiraceae bacterium]|nr:MBL fold metallo-hydrolase [Lachnospiraceae bacterium]